MRHVTTFGKAVSMKDEIVLSDNLNHVYDDINDLIKQKKYDVRNAVNDAMISLYWGIGKKLTEEITGVNKPEYGKKVVIEIGNRLSVDYGAGFNKSAISRMINFYQEFPDYEKVATLSQQLTWSHSIEIIPMKTGQFVHYVNVKNPCFMNAQRYQKDLMRR